MPSRFSRGRYDPTEAEIEAVEVSWEGNAKSDTRAPAPTIFSRCATRERERRDVLEGSFADQLVLSLTLVEWWSDRRSSRYQGEPGEVVHGSNLSCRGKKSCIGEQGRHDFKSIEGGDLGWNGIGGRSYVSPHLNWEPTSKFRLSRCLSLRCISPLFDKTDKHKRKQYV